MKNYAITVNDGAYAVTVEEGAVSDITAVPTAPTAAPATPATPVAAPAPAAVPAGAVGSAGVPAPMPSEIVTVKVTAGQAVKKGDIILVLETMKMENNIVALQDGTTASTNTSADDSVESGAVLATLN